MVYGCETSSPTKLVENKLRSELREVERSALGITERLKEYKITNKSGIRLEEQTLSKGLTEHKMF